MSEELTTEEKHERKMQRRNHRKLTLERLAQQEDLFFDECITTAEDERTVMAKNDATNNKKRAIDSAHNKDRSGSTPGYVQRVRNATYTATTKFNRAFGRLLFQKRVSFRLCPESNYWGKTKVNKEEEANDEHKHSHGRSSRSSSSGKWSSLLPSTGSSTLSTVLPSFSSSLP